MPSGDIEGHQGSDGRFYVLDFARTFPSEARLVGDPEEKGAFLYKLLRRELLRKNPVPLNPDSFTSTIVLFVSSHSSSVEQPGPESHRARHQHQDCDGSAPDPDHP